MTTAALVIDWLRRNCNVAYIEYPWGSKNNSFIMVETECATIHLHIDHCVINPRIGTPPTLVNYADPSLCQILENAIDPRSYTIPELLRGFERRTPEVYR